MRELRFVSDAHLGAVPPPSADQYAASFADFVRRTAADGADLVLLGDVFDLLGAVDVPAHRREAAPTQEDVAIEALERIHARHGDVFSALGALVESGAALHVVAGNHDAELTLPRVQQRLRELVGVDGPVTFHPWFLRIPGVVHAEHGHLHHDINRVEEPLGPSGGAIRLPLGSHLPTRDAGRVALVCALPRLARVGLRLADPRRSRRRDAYVRDVVGPRAPSLGMSRAAAAATLAVSEPTVASVVLRMARKLVSRRPVGPTTQQGDYLHVGVQRVHEVLRRTGEDVPLYVVGHAHVAEALPLDGAMYLNCGTWSPFVSSVVDRRPSYVSVRYGSGPPSASVGRWSADAGRH